MTEQNELDELLKSSSSEHESGQYDYEGDFEPEESASTTKKYAKKSERTSKRKQDEESLEDFELIDEQEQRMKKQPTSTKALNKIAEPKPKSVSKGSGSNDSGKPSKQNPNFSKNKNKTESVPAKKVEQVLTLDQFEGDELPVSPTKSIKVMVEPEEKVEESVPEFVADSVGEEVDEDIGVDEAVTEQLEESLAKSRDEIESSEEVVSMVMQSRDITQSKMSSKSKQQASEISQKNQKKEQNLRPSEPKPKLKPTSNIPQVISLVEVKEDAQKQNRKPSAQIKQTVHRPDTAQPAVKKPVQEIKAVVRKEQRRPSTAKTDIKKPTTGKVKVVELPQKPKQQNKPFTKQQEEGDKPKPVLPIIRGTLKIPLLPPPKIQEKVVKKKPPQAPNFGTKGLSTTGLSAQQFEKAVENWKLKEQLEEEAKKRQEYLNRRRSPERFNEYGVSVSNLPQGEYERRAESKRKREEEQRQRMLEQEQAKKIARKQGKSHLSPPKFDEHGVSITGLNQEELLLRLQEKKQRQEESARKRQQEQDDFALARRQGRTKPSPPKFDKFGVSVTGLSEQELKERAEKEKEKQLLKQKYQQMVREEEARKENKQQQKLDKLFKRKKDKGDSKSKRSAEDNDFKVEVDDGDQVQLPELQNAQNQAPSRKDIAKSKKAPLSQTGGSETSSAKALEAQDRIKRERQKKKQMEESIEQELKKKIFVLNKEPEPPKPEKVKQLRKLLKDDEVKYARDEQVVEKKDANSTEIMHLKDNIKKLRGEQRRLKERIVEQQQIYNRLTNRIRLEEREDNVLIVDKNRKEYTSYGLVGDLKKITKTLKAEQLETKNATGSQESPVEKFVAYFQSESYELTDIFTCLDINGDGLLTTKEIKDICLRLNIRNMKSNQLEEVIQLLDYNSDGSISKDEFEFVIGSELEKKTQMHKLLGSIQVDNPIEIEERILDMKARIKYMNEVIEAGGNEQQGQPKSDPKHQRLLVKLKALEDKVQRRRIAAANSKTKVLPAKAEIQRLSQELRIAEIETSNNERLYQTMKRQIDDNIREKTECLKARVQEHLRCRERLYELENDLHEKQLRFITYQKIHDNKRRHVEQGREEERQRQQRVKQTVEYKAGILNQKTRVELTSKLQEMTLISAVLMIQRNFRKKKAMREYEQLRQNPKKVAQH